MRKFELYNPIRMVFGAGEFKRLGELASPYGKKPLVVVGESHARDTGLLDRGLELLRKAGMDPVVFEGIEPNPRVATCQRAARIARDSNCDMVIGIGGGSVMDASKVIAFGFYDPEQVWCRIATWKEGCKPVEKALPIVLASTLAATGSEGDAGAVISNDETLEKAGVFSPAIYPKVSIIDPELTLTTSVEYTRDGAVDMMIHVMESYFNGDPKAHFSDRVTEGFVVEVMLALEAIMENPADIEARSQLSYLGAIALSGFINAPRGGAFPVHAMGHLLSAHFNISHGRTLALIMPRWLRFISREKQTKIIQFGERVFSMTLDSYHPPEAIDRTIDRFEEWLDSVGAWFFFDNLDIPNDPAKLQEMAESTITIYGNKKGLLDGIKPLSVDDIVTIYRNCIRIGAPVDEIVKEELVDEEQERIEEIEKIAEGIMKEQIDVEEGTITESDKA